MIKKIWKKYLKERQISNREKELHKKLEEVLLDLIELSPDRCFDTIPRKIDKFPEEFILKNQKYTLKISSLPVIKPFTYYKMILLRNNFQGEMPYIQFEDTQSEKDREIIDFVITNIRNKAFRIDKIRELEKSQKRNDKLEKILF